MANRYHPFFGWVPCKLHRTFSICLECWYSTVLSVLPHVGRPKTPCFERRIFFVTLGPFLFASKNHWQHIGYMTFQDDIFLSFCRLFGCKIPSSLAFFSGGRWFDRTLGTSFHTSFPPQKGFCCFFSFDSKLGLPHSGKTLNWSTWLETEIPWFFGSAFYDGNCDPIIVSASDGMYTPEI